MINGDNERILKVGLTVGLTNFVVLKSFKALMYLKDSNRYAVKDTTI